MASPLGRDPGAEQRDNERPTRPQRSRLGRPIKTCPKCHGPRFMPSLVSEQDWTCMDCDYSTYDDEPLDAETFDFLASVGGLKGVGP